MDKALSVTEAFIKSAMLPIILVGVSFAFPPAGVFIARFSAVGCGVLAVIPDKKLPDSLKKIKEDTSGRVIMLFTEGPQAVIEDIGQDFMDGIRTPEGIAAYAGATFGVLAGVKIGKAHRIKKNKNPDVDDLKAPKDVDDVKPDVKKKDSDVGKVGKETELFLPDEYYNKYLPNQVTLGTKYLAKYDELGNVKQIKMYDDYGREIGWVDFTNHGYGNTNSPHYHTTPHWHEIIYNAQYPDGIKIHHRTDINTPLGDK